tara:strand:- start:497 stop:775 length:279 start_codon:yes stop_codon:yes gene_type:complete
MKKYIIIMSVVVALAGCSTVKKWVGWGEDSEEPKIEETMRPPHPHEVVKNEDGTYTVVLEPEKSKLTSVWPWVASLVVLVGVSLVIRSRMKK